MNRMPGLAAVALALAAAGCTYSDTTTRAVAAGPPLSSAEQACLDYGLAPGTSAYSRCVTRQAEMRASVRVVPTYPAAYPEAQLHADSRAACSSYGLLPGSATYDRCVTSEMNARRYRGEAAYRPPAGPVVYGSAYPPAYAAAGPAYAPGVEAFRDEYGFRYDAQGNRLDRYGNIVSPYSTRP